MSNGTEKGRTNERQRAGIPHARPIEQLQGVGPVEREKIARWLEAHELGWEKEIHDLAAALGQGMPASEAANKITYAKNAISVVRQLAWHVRTARGGPLAGQRAKRKPSQAS